jgi:hypothetical protein
MPMATMDARTLLQLRLAFLAQKHYHKLHKKILDEKIPQGLKKISLSEKINKEI